jgi:hypothetical protein
MLFPDDFPELYSGVMAFARQLVTGMIFRHCVPPLFLFSL